MKDAMLCSSALIALEWNTLAVSGQHGPESNTDVSLISPLPLRHAVLVLFFGESAVSETTRGMERACRWLKDFGFIKASGGKT